MLFESRLVAGCQPGDSLLLTIIVLVNILFLMVVCSILLKTNSLSVYL